MIIGIIGAGASGMAAAIFAAQDPENQVLLWERQARVGRKLQATGNGRCNLTNLHADTTHYHGEAPEFTQAALSQFAPEQTLAWFEKLGLFTVTEASGKVYPYSDQANSVVDILRFALDRPNISLITGFEVQKLRKGPEGFTVSDGQTAYQCDRVIVACGGLAGTKLGGTMAGYKLLGKLGHKCTRLRPALVQVKCAWGGVVSLKGVRTNCAVRICRDGEVFSQSTGELQFTEYGLSGPVIFECSRDACQGAGEWTAKLDFLPHVTPEDLLEALKSRRQMAVSAEDLLTGILHNRLGRVLSKSAGISGTAPIRELTDGELIQVVRAVKDFEIRLTEPLGMDSAQVTAGGILTGEFDPETMESKKLPGLYACGEVLDIDGDCGGYNLQWAWSSGRLAGLCAGKEQT